MPGISGGTLCVAFGMYEPLLHIFSHPRKAIRKDGLKLLFFLLGVGIGFFGLAGLAGWLMAKNSQAVTCVFIGFIIGTIPELWRDAGKEGRTLSSFLSMFAGFALLLSILLLLRHPPFFSATSPDKHRNPAVLITFPLFYHSILKSLRLNFHILSSND